MKLLDELKELQEKWQEQAIRYQSGIKEAGDGNDIHEMHYCAGGYLVSTRIVSELTTLIAKYEI